MREEERNGMSEESNRPTLKSGRDIARSRKGEKGGRGPLKPCIFHRATMNFALVERKVGNTTVYEGRGASEEIYPPEWGYVGGSEHQNRQHGPNVGWGGG